MINHLSFEFKKELHTHLMQRNDEKITALKKELKSVQEDANSETKSSMGDKYETGRAMAHLQTEKLQAQLSELLNKKKVLEGLSPKQTTSETIKIGSLIETDKGIFYIAISEGITEYNGNKLMLISPVSPIGKLLIGCNSGDTINFNNTSYTVIKHV